MWTKIKRWLAPPIFEDQNKTRSAKLLNTILLFLLVSTIVFVPLTYVLADNEVFDPFTLIIGLLLVFISVGLLIAARRGHVRSAGFIITTAMFLLASINVLQAADVSGAATVGLILVVTIAAVLLDGRWAIIFAALSVSTIALIGFLQTQEILQPTFAPNLLIDIALYIVVTILVSLLLWSTMNALKNVLTQVETTNAQLRALSTSLEERVAARTLDITLAAEIGRRLAQQRDIDQLLHETVNLIQSNFNLYHVQVYLAGADGKRLILRAATGVAGTELIQRNHHLTVSPSSINGLAALDKRPIVIPNVLENPLFRPNTLLPDTRCEMVVPLMVREKLMGTLNLQDNQTNGLTIDNLPAFETLAGQLATALDNATLFAQIRESQAILTEQTRRLTREGWQEYLNAIDRQERIGYTYNLQGTTPQLEDELQTAHNPLFVTQIKVLDESVGTIQIENSANQQWDADSAKIVQAVADQVAQQIENLRLLDEAEKFRLEAEEASRSLIREGWQSFEDAADMSPLLYDGNQIHKLPETSPETADHTIPLQIRGEAIGTLNLSGLPPNNQQNQILITTVSDALSSHIENLRLSQTTQTALAKTEIQARRLTLLNRMSTQLNSATEWEDILTILLSQTPRILNADSARLSLLLPDHNFFELYILPEEGLSNAPPSFAKQIPVANTSIEQAIRERQILTVADLSQSIYSDFIPLAQLGFHSAMQAPLILGERILGAIGLTSKEQAYIFTDAETSLLQQIAAVIATTIDNYRLLEQVTRRANRESIINNINQKIQRATSVEAALEIATREIGQQLKTQHIAIEITANQPNGHE